MSVNIQVDVGYEAPSFTCQQCGQDTRVVRYGQTLENGERLVGYDWKCGCKTTDDGVDGGGARVLDAEDAWAARQRRAHEEYKARCPCYPCRSKDDDTKG